MQIHGTHGPDSASGQTTPQIRPPISRPFSKLDHGPPRAPRPSQVPPRPPIACQARDPGSVPPPPRQELATRVTAASTKKRISRSRDFRSARRPPPAALRSGASGSFGRGRGAHLSLLRPPRVCKLRSGMVRLAWTVALGLFPSFSLAKQWLLRIRCREDFTIRPLGSETRKTSAALLRAAAAARRSQNGAATASRFYSRRAQATPPTPPGTRLREGARPPGNQARPPLSESDWRTARGRGETTP